MSEAIKSSAEEGQAVNAYGWAARDSSGILSPFHFTRRTTGSNDISIKILYCGICHTDLHFVKDEAGMTIYPIVPGHEIVGEVTKVGSSVTKFKVGDIAGVGGMAVGAKVTVISTSPNKKKEAMEQLGVDDFLISHDREQLQAAVGTMDGIIDTVSASHSLLPLINLLKTDGKLIMVGAPLQPPELPVFPLIMGRKLIAGSLAGGMKETQEMIDFAAKHDITADVEVIPMEYVNTALERVGKNDVKYRFVIDVTNTLNSPY
ncbi:hypothetical protein M0R45_004873 [Rubus argutus]|uniref:Enoyl reductase (ER) domain-containing protein n=1 Tax=Rubus argutus TaxID=59490 RepID=A0AAW1YLJ7_RUBAR